MYLAGIHSANIIIWIVAGALVGYVIGVLLVGRVRRGLVTSVLVGVIGAVFTALLLYTFMPQRLTAISLESVFMALAGATIVSYIHRFVL